MSAPKNETRARVAAGVLLVVVPLVAAYAYNVSGNVAARDRARAECTRIREAVPGRWAELEPATRSLFQDDTPVVERLVLDMGADTCEALDRELASPMAWGWGRTWSAPPASEDELRELHEVTGRAAERCPRVMAPMLVAVTSALPEGEREAAVRETCESMLSPLERFVTLPSESAEPVALWDWPAQLGRIADALETPSTPAP